MSEPLLTVRQLLEEQRRILALLEQDPPEQPKARWHDQFGRAYYAPGADGLQAIPVVPMRGAT